MTDDIIDKVTAKLFLALQILFLEHPVRTSCSLIISSIFYLGFDVYPILFEILHVKNNIKTKLFFCIIIFSICNIKTIWQSLRGKYVDEKTEKILHMIENSNLNKTQRDMQMMAFLNKFIAEGTIKKEVKEEKQS